MPIKTCSKCGKKLPTSDFHKMKGGRFGVRSNCKQCQRAHVTSRYNTPEGKKKKQVYRLDPLANMRGRIRVRHRQAMMKYGIRVIGVSLQQIVGADAKTLLEHIETAFSDGMSWHNMEKWDLDHATPIYTFDLELEEERVAAFHYTNLVPVWTADHKQKSIDDLLPLRLRQDKFLRHLEQHFLPGMSWANTTEWFVDALRGPQDFDLRKPSERRKFFHYTNYVPRWRRDGNCSRGRPGADVRS
jgi:hypothetical protein